MYKLYQHSNLIDLEFRNLYKRIAELGVAGAQGPIGPDGPDGQDGEDAQSDLVNLTHVIDASDLPTGSTGTSPTVVIASFNHPPLIQKIHVDIETDFDPLPAAEIGVRFYLSPTWGEYLQTGYWACLVDDYAIFNVWLKYPDGAGGYNVGTGRQYPFTDGTYGTYVFDNRFTAPAYNDQWNLQNANVTHDWVIYDYRTEWYDLYMNAHLGGCHPLRTTYTVPAKKLMDWDSWILSYACYPIGGMSPTQGKMWVNLLVSPITGY